MAGTAATRTTRPGLKFGAIELGRAFAAIFVVLHHSGSIMREPRFWGAEPFAGHFRNFNVGVDFFFVLSGFIITWVHRGDLGRPERLGNYARKRFLRIYPPYWGVTIPLILLYLAFPAGGDPTKHDPANILRSLLLLPNPVQPVLGVAWTLTYEIFFYALFACIIFAGRRALIALPIWAAAILIAYAALPPQPFPIGFLLSPYNLEFMMGVASALVLARYPIPAPGLLVLIGVASFLALMLFALHVQDDPLRGRMAFGIPSVLFVLGTAELERRRPIRLPALARLLGAASFAIYLVHPVLLSFGCQAVVRLGGRALPPDVASLLLAAIAVTVGVGYHLLLERRLVALVGRLVPEPRRTA
ncbi:acyltransferase family protein [Sphingomonas morindae]|uniref:Acyltransferase n=1 Tax=Sphingomonas morindae TaxID=1541170 RepID=A0ABY4X6J6_9SPHN|nr:acyltransferase [Sphingomonas morindae]USI72465.1 acyltransferase [Sphingomonas morindae]